jgi:hypothetical protein
MSDAEAAAAPVASKNWRRVKLWFMGVPPVEKTDNQTSLTMSVGF